MNNDQYMNRGDEQVVDIDLSSKSAVEADQPGIEVEMKVQAKMQEEDEGVGDQTNAGSNWKMMNQEMREHVYKVENDQDHKNID